MTENWRTAVDGQDYFGQQKKRVALEQRRPSIRKASDLVGPGISLYAVRLTDYNDILATYNGYYSSEAGATDAPDPVGIYVGTVVSDATLGGVQTFTDITTNDQYRRCFERNPGDPDFITWGSWVPV